MCLNKKLTFLVYFTAFISALTLINGCASMQQPEGGPRDTIAPSVIKEIPENYTRNFNNKKILIELDEYFKLNNEYTEISISPTPEVNPFYKIKKKTLEIELKDSLEKNTTYTINFGNAIADVNEGNKLKNYSYVFSTGPEIDSLQISGKVVNYLDNKPILDATVFIIPVSRDSIFGKKRASIYTATDSSGNFHLKNLKEENYRLYALKEENGGDRVYNNAKEMIGFVSDDIKLNKDTSEILIKLFKQYPEEYRNVDRKIENDGRITIIYNRPLEKPAFKIIEPEIKDPIFNYSLNGDTTTLWVKKMEFDSLKIVTNSGNKILDTLTLKRSKRDTYTRNITFNTNLVANKIKPGTDLTLTFNVPIENIDKNLIAITQDSTRIPNYLLQAVDKNNRVFKIVYPWKVKKMYAIEIKDEAITDIYGTKNKALKGGFELDEVENYGNLSLNMVKSDTAKNYIVQLLDEKQNVLKENPITKNEIINYPMMPNGKYIVRVVYDANNNGIFDSGNVFKKIQPEKIWLYDKEIVIRPNWDREEKITIPKDFD